MVSLQAPADERIFALDVIRGFAVMGIFFVNVPEMAGNGSSFVSVYTGFDAFIRLIYDMFVQTKFYTIFAFLFGLGFYLFMQSAERKGMRPEALFVRRLLLLLLLGLFHAVFIWFGDVLYSYAAIGFLLLLFYHRSSKTLLIWSLILMFLFALLMVLVSVYAGNASLTSDINKPVFKELPDTADRYRYLLEYGIANLFLLVFEVLGLFLLGLYAGKKRWFEPDRWNPRVVRRVQWTALIASAVLFIPMIQYYLAYDAYYPNAISHYTHLTGKTMAVFYVCTLLRLIHRYGERRFRSLASVGRTALSNYLLQSVITLLLLQLVRSYAGEMPLWTGTVYCVIIFAGQVWISRLWLSRYRIGPMEWLWRAGTYGQRPPFRRSQTPPPRDRKPSAGA